MVKFTVDTLPHLLHIYALAQGVAVHPKLAALAKESVGRIALIAGTVASDVGVLGTSVLKDVTRMTSSVLEAQNNIASSAGPKGIKMAGKVVENLINVSDIYFLFKLHTKTLRDHLSYL